MWLWLKPWLSIVRLAAAGAAGLAVLAGGAALYHRHLQEPVFAAAGHDPAAAARLLAKTFPPASAGCADDGFGRDGAAVLTALEMIERFATSPVERDAERLILFTARNLAFEPPDLSYGPMQIRLSTARRVARGRITSATVLLDVCAARGITRLMIEQDLGLPLGVDAHLTRAQVLSIAALHNGQRHNGGPADRVIANRVYREVTYHLFQEVRFGDLHERQAWNGGN